VASRTMAIADDIFPRLPNVPQHIVTDVVMMTLDHPENLTPSTERVVRAQEYGWEAKRCLDDNNFRGAEAAIISLLTILEETSD